MKKALDFKRIIQEKAKNEKIKLQNLWIEEQKDISSTRRSKENVLTQNKIQGNFVLSSKTALKDQKISKERNETWENYRSRRKRLRVNTTTTTPITPTSVGGFWNTRNFVEIERKKEKPSWSFFFLFQTAQPSQAVHT